MVSSIIYYLLLIIVIVNVTLPRFPKGVGPDQVPLSL